MIDPYRGKPLRAFAVVVWVAWVASVVMGPTMFGDSDEKIAVIEAFNHAIDVSDRVGDFAVARQQLPDSAEGIALPARPGSVSAVTVGPEGRVRVTIGSRLPEVAGGAIVFTPKVENGSLNWACSDQGIPAKHRVTACR